MELITKMIKEKLVAENIQFRNRANSKGDPKVDCGALMWLAWGGDEGIAWAKRKLSEIDK